MKLEYRMDLYALMEKEKPNMMERAKKVPDEIGIPKEKRANLGLSGGSATHAMLLEESIQSIVEGSRKITNLATLDVEIRRLVKSYYGDEYDGAVVNTCEAALWLLFDVLYTPSFLHRGNSSIFRYIAPYEKHVHHQAGYGSPVPPKYKDISADRGVTAGELGVYAKRLANLEVILVPLLGADYSCHGIKYHPCTLLRNVKGEESVKKIREVAEANRPFLSGFTSMGYDTPGYGYGEVDENGTPILMKGIGSISSELNVPYVVDNARGTPFIGTDPRSIGADAIVYSTDKAFFGPTGGLIIGTEEVMIPIRRAIGIHGQRWGTGSSHGKAGYVTFDPGKECLEGLIPVLRMLVEEPERLKKPLDEFHELIKEEFSLAKSQLGRFADGFEFTKTYNSLCTMINYEKTWEGEGLGFPIFSIEDMYSGSNPIQSGIKAMGLIPCLGYDANLMVGPGLGTLDSKGNLLEEESRFVLKALFKMMGIIAEVVDSA